ncbi:MAG TPA: HEAT repeat domain-containing protein [Caldilineaceae bacterium]|nr:HEAT repeat domain-containing protein [Caldilineaceae bacterium]
MLESSCLSRLTVAVAQQDDTAAEAAVLGLNPTDEPALLLWLTATDPERRWWAMRPLAACGGSLAAAAIASQLETGDPQLRGVAAFALGHLHQRVPEAVNPHLAGLANRLSDNDGSVRQAAADALALCGDDAVATLATVLASEDQAARTRAAYALRKIASPGAATILFRCLNDTNYMVHTYAYEGLDELGLLDNLLVIP